MLTNLRYQGNESQNCIDISFTTVRRTNMKKIKMLVSVQGKRKPYTLILQLWIDEATVEISMEFQKNI